MQKKQYLCWRNSIIWVWFTEFKREWTRDHDLEQLNKHIMRNGSPEGTENSEDTENPEGIEGQKELESIGRHQDANEVVTEW